MRDGVSSIIVGTSRKLAHQDDDDAHDSEASFDVHLLTHDPTNCLGNANGSFANDNDGEKAHTLHKMCFLKAEHTPEA